MTLGRCGLVLITLIVLSCTIFVEKTVLAKESLKRVTSWGDEDQFLKNDELSSLSTNIGIPMPQDSPSFLSTSSTPPIYLCRENSTSCVFIVRDSSSSSPTNDINSATPRVIQHVDGYGPDFSEEKRPVRLYNGTIVGKKPLEEQRSLSENGDELDSNNDGSSIHNSNEILSTELRKKILALDTMDEEVDQNHLKEDGGDISNQSRIIAYTIRTNPPANNGTSSSTLGNYPTITLAQLARSLIFPDWLWSRFASPNRRKTGPSDTVPLSSTKGAPIPLRPQLSSISFDNNFSRFLKLFTLVRFENSACASPAALNGTCLNSRQCMEQGGTATTQCANGFGVCCVFQVRCGGRTSRNGTYFVDTGVVFQANQVQTCNVQILKTTPAVRQIRLDFQIFSLRQPVAGSCEIDRFIVSGQDTNNIIPILCGTNTGSHIYIETAGTSSSIQLSIMTTGDGVRNWSIRITQYDNINPSGSAPTHCLQYYQGVMGAIQSFNYVTSTSPQYLNNLNYAVCIRRESGFCSLTYTNVGPDGTYQPFQIVNANAEGALIIPSGQAGVGVRDCPYDYILINGYRLCGERLNDATTNVIFVEDAPITDISNGPFTVGVRTNEIDVGGGFNLYFRQNPCMSSPG